MTAPCPGSAGCDPSSARFAAEVTITAPGWDASSRRRSTRLRAAGRDLLLLAGGWLEVGVHSTMRSANDRGYECLLVPSACIAIDDTTRAATISSTEMSGGIFGAVAGPSSTSVLFLVPRSDCDERTYRSTDLSARLTPSPMPGPTTASSARPTPP